MSESNKHIKVKGIAEEVAKIFDDNKVTDKEALQIINYFIGAMIHDE